MCCSLSLNSLPTNDLMPSLPSETTRLGKSRGGRFTESRLIGSGLGVESPLKSQ
jgi:hypothetical protein